jgi:hypothetical protein
VSDGLSLFDSGSVAAQNSISCEIAGCSEFGVTKRTN